MKEFDVGSLLTMLGCSGNIMQCEIERTVWPGCQLEITTAWPPNFAEGNFASRVTQNEKFLVPFLDFSFPFAPAATGREATKRVNISWFSYISDPYEIPMVKSLRCPWDSSFFVISVRR